MQEAEKVYLKKISLENFRCFEKVEVDLQKKLTLVVGANGAGKTSLLESIAIAIDVYKRQSWGTYPCDFRAGFYEKPPERIHLTPCDHGV